MSLFSLKIINSICARHARNGPYDPLEATNLLIFDRFLARLFGPAGSGDTDWVLWGSAALAKHLGVHRKIKDLDINFFRGGLPAAVDDLAERLVKPNGDGLSYALENNVTVRLGVGGSFPVWIHSGGSAIANFSIDIGINRIPTQPPVWLVEPFISQNRLDYRGAWVAHPVDILSDKVMAIFKPPYTSRGFPRFTNRGKDLVDAVAAAQQLNVDAASLALSLRAKAIVEEVDLDNLNVANLEWWRHEYRKEAVGSPRLGRTLPSFEEGYDRLRLMCRLALSGEEGAWDWRSQSFQLGGVPECRPAASPPRIRSGHMGSESPQLAKPRSPAARVEMGRSCLK